MSLKRLHIGRKFSFIALVMFAFFEIGCKRKVELVYGPNTFHVNEKGLIDISIDPNDAKKEEITSTFVDSITYLPLQTSPESTFGSITQLEVTPDAYIIWDEVTNAILFFNKKGEFISKISNKDTKVSIPYKKIDHFAIDLKKKELMFNDRHSALVYYYDLNGKFLRTAKKPAYIIPAYTIFNGLKIYYQSYNFRQLTSIGQPACNVAIVDQDNKMKFYLPYDTTAVDFDDTKGVGQWFFNNQNGFLNFSVPYDYNVYTIDSAGKVSVAFHLTMPDVYSVPEDFMTNSTYLGKRKKYTDSNNEIIYGITDFYRFGDNVVFRLYGHAYDQIFTYNLKSKNLRSLVGYVSDKKTYGLPIAKYAIHALDDKGHFISSLSAGALFNLKLMRAGNQEWEESLPDQLKKFFESDNLQNPVLTFISLKQKI